MTRVIETTEEEHPVFCLSPNCQPVKAMENLRALVCHLVVELKH